jgi:hypothetical protein
MTTLSKSKFMQGLACPRLLWCIFNAPEKIPPIDEDTQAIFDQGHEVGDLAKKRFPGGIEVARDKNKVKTTAELVKQGKIIFEGGFGYKNAYCEADILVPYGKEWELIEVKSSSQVKEEHIPDVAFQLYCLKGAGIHVRKCHVMCVDSEYVRKGNIDVKKFFHIEDVTEQVLEVLPTIEDQIDEFVKMIQSPKMPAFAWEGVCEDICGCPVCSLEIDKLPEHNVTQMNYFKKKAYALLNKGVKLIKDIPDDLLNEKQKVEKKGVISGKTQIDKSAVKGFLAGIKYPLYLIDFETISPAIPLFDGTRPYQQIPFQLSLHVVNGSVTHHDFLAADDKDPRPGIIKALKLIGPKGTVMAYNSGFEEAIIENLIKAFPKEKHLHSLIDRMVDLGEPFSKYQYYNIAQHGQWSLKAVLPALTGKDYSGLEIQGGSTAARKFLEMTYKLKKQDARIREALLRYCEQDTQAMIDILRVLDKVF